MTQNVLKWGASSRWSLDPKSARCSKETATILKIHSTLNSRKLIFQTKCKSEISFFSKISIFWAKYALYNQCETVFISRWTENSSKRTKNELSRSTKRTFRRFNLTAKGSEMSFWISKIFWFKILARKILIWQFLVHLSRVPQNGTTDRLANGRLRLGIPNLFNKIFFFQFIIKLYLASKKSKIN